MAILLKILFMMTFAVSHDAVMVQVEPMEVEVEQRLLDIQEEEAAHKEDVLRALEEFEKHGGKLPELEELKPKAE